MNPPISEATARRAARKSVLLQQAFHMPSLREHPIQFLESFLDPLANVISLWWLAVYFEGELAISYMVLGFIIFSMTFPGPGYLRESVWHMVRGIVASWATMAGLLLLFGYASHTLHYFDPDVVQTWLWLSPLSQVAIRLGLRAAGPWLVKQAGVRKAVIAGVNHQGLALVERLTANPLSGIQVTGLFDDRSPDRLPAHEGLPLLGKLADLPRHAQQSDIEIIYLSLPMATQPRILRLLDELRDTTVSIYFVPDIFVTDLIQGRMDVVDDIPVVAVCESPFTGINGAVKRISDVVLSLLILLLISPLLLLVALGVKLTSPGPVIFKQRRYGLDGKEIMVYKFRSMTVCEDGAQIKQAQKGDARITPFGAFLRKTSLDELPQFINVLQGRMSIVGPRPHAIAHNELYRKLIKGYMIRHKVKPGITGWAQVNGLRGETKTLDRMEARIEHDLYYLRNWSLRLDLEIIAKSALVVLKDQSAY